MHLSGHITSPIPLENVEIRHVIVKLPANEIATVHYAAWEDTDGSVLMVNFTGKHRRLCRLRVSVSSLTVCQRFCHRVVRAYVIWIDRIASRYYVFH